MLEIDLFSWHVLSSQCRSCHITKLFLSNFKNIIWPTLGKQSVKLKSIIMRSTSVVFFLFWLKTWTL